MLVMPKRPCIRCGVLVSGSYCQAHDPGRARDRGRYRVTPGRSARAQAKFRARVIAQAGGRCQFVDEYGQRCNVTTGLTAHHLIPFIESGSMDPASGACLCTHHHAVVEARLRAARAA